MKLLFSNLGGCLKKKRSFMKYRPDLHSGWTILFPGRTQNRLDQLIRYVAEATAESEAAQKEEKSE